jgi:hypothetical protein
VIHDFWKQSELDTYSFHELVEINAVIHTLEENKRRAQVAAEKNLPRK